RYPGAGVLHGRHHRRGLAKSREDEGRRVRINASRIHGTHHRHADAAVGADRRPGSNFAGREWLPRDLARTRAIDDRTWYRRIDLSGHGTDGALGDSWLC